MVSDKEVYDEKEIACLEDYSCFSAIKVCSSDCVINCKGTWACVYMKAQCPEKSICRAICTGNVACFSTKFVGNWKIDCSGVSSCMYHKMCKEWDISC